MDSRQILLSDQFVISCGTVTIDPQRSKVLLIKLRTTDEYFLPKGRKDICESLEEAAKRETLEETGIRVELLPLKINTLATVPSAAIAANTQSKTVTEPIAMTQRKDAAGTLKIIFWFVAEGDSASVPEQRQQQEGEDFDTCWKDFDEAAAALSFDDDRRVAAAAIDAFHTAKP